MSKNSSQSAPPDAAAIATASYAAFTSAVYLHLGNDQQDNSSENNVAVNLYDVIGELPPTTSAAAAADGVDKFSENGGKLTTALNHPYDSSKNVGNVYDTIDEDVPSQATALSSQPAAREAEAGYTSMADNVYLKPRKPDYDVPTSTSSSSQPASLPPSASEAAVLAAGFSVDAESEYVPASNTVNNVPCDYELESKIKPNDVVAYANSPELNTDEQSNV